MCIRDSAYPSVFLKTEARGVWTHLHSWVHGRLASRHRRRGDTGTDRRLSAGCQQVEVVSGLADRPGDRSSRDCRRRRRPQNTSRLLAWEVSGSHTGPLHTSVKPTLVNHPSPLIKCQVLNKRTRPNCEIRRTLNRKQKVVFIRKINQTNCGRRFSRACL